MKGAATVIAGGFLAATVALAQSPSSSGLPAAAPLSADLAPAAFLLGKWRGGGWIEFQPGRKSDFRQFETISAKLGGGAIVMEGLGTRTGVDGKEMITHEALGVLTWDAKERKPLFRAYRSGGQFVDADVSFGPGRLTWQFRIPGVGDTRYTIVLNDKGQWFEIGEMAKDGIEWRKFFETTLDRAP